MIRLFGMALGSIFDSIQPIRSTQNYGMAPSEICFISKNSSATPSDLKKNKH